MMRLRGIKLKIKNDLFWKIAENILREIYIEV